MSIARIVTVAVLAAALVAPDVRAGEEFDQDAVACATVELGAFVPVDERDWFGAAAIWALCLEEPADAELSRVRDVLEIAVGDDRKRLKRRKKALGVIGAFVSQQGEIGVALASPDPEVRELKGYEKLARELVTTASETRVLSLSTGLQTSRLVIGGIEARADWIMSKIEKHLEDLADAEGADQTRQGKKALRLIVLAGELREGIEVQSEILSGISVDALPAFDAKETRQDARTRVIIRREARAIGSLLVSLAKVESKIEKLVDKAVNKVRNDAACPLTDPEDPFEGGGWVRVSIDGAPEVELKGDTGVSFTSEKRRIVFMGSDISVRPNVLFELYGTKTTKAGTHAVRDRPASDDAFKRNFAVGSYKVDRDVYWFVSGTLVIDTFKTGKKRLIAGSFDVVGRTEEGEELRLVGTYHLCRFGIEYRDGIDLPD
jgi:hypothetical protein